MSEQQMANYTLAIQADNGYESTTEGRCTAEQYWQAIAALHGTSPPAQRQARSADTWVVPDFLTAHVPETPEYRNGWNDCRQLMMEMYKREIK